MVQNTNLTEITRGNLFPLWFSSKEKLRSLCTKSESWDLEENSSPSDTTGNLLRLLDNLPLDAPAFCECLIMAPWHTSDV